MSLPGWLSGCIMAGCGAPSSHPSTRTAERVHPWVITKYTSLPRGAPWLKRHQKDPRTALLWALQPPRAGPTLQGTELTPGLTAHAGLAWVPPEQSGSLDRLIVPLLLQGTVTLPGTEHRESHMLRGQHHLPPWVSSVGCTSSQG